MIAGGDLFGLLGCAIPSLAVPEKSSTSPPLIEFACIGARFPPIYVHYLFYAKRCSGGRESD
jgi:hypothetical protein